MYSIYIPPEFKKWQQAHAVSSTSIKSFFCALLSPLSTGPGPASTQTSLQMPRWTASVQLPMALPLPPFSRLQTTDSLPSTFCPQSPFLFLPWILLQEFQLYLVIFLKNSCITYYFHFIDDVYKAWGYEGSEKQSQGICWEMILHRVPCVSCKQRYSVPSPLGGLFKCVCAANFLKRQKYLPPEQRACCPV